MRIFNLENGRKPYSTTHTHTHTHTHLKPADKNFSYKSQQVGRSMIEMLGVLAIIGVLSIGGIAGFSKAMYKHKLNKQAEQISHIIQEVDNYHEQFATTNGYYITHVFYALGAIPKEMQKNNNTTYFYDVFDNQGFIYCRASGNYCGVSISGLKDKPFDQCKNILEIATRFHESLWLAETLYGGDGGFRVWGDAYCTSGYKAAGRCLNNLTPVVMNKLCKSCESQPDKTCGFLIAWKR